MTGDLKDGRVDISCTVELLYPGSFGIYAFPRVIEYAYEKFYTWTGKQEHSFVTTVISSRFVIGCLLATFVVCWLALCLSDFVESGWRWNYGLFMDFASFLVASFLATSFPIPENLAGGKTSLRAKCQALIFLV
ncbi:hypothetical protein HPB48_016628 [Haemaphysalis longicornis]|uniref:Transporter n=1 Tax=Haemaphysalis longicornis TaxID=44386 RepID=A0A9J6FT18_HAELO|nr:hypothetical protein HPB48_016628 [Haemaphysalis longicornis]